ncbi:hypothetical protein D3C87_2082930 [compost metagenome]
MKPSAAWVSMRSISLSATSSAEPMKSVRGVAASSAASRRVWPLSAALRLMRSVVERKLFLPISPSSGKGASSG